MVQSTCHFGGSAKGAYKAWLKDCFYNHRSKVIAYLYAISDAALSILGIFCHSVLGYCIMDWALVLVLIN